jgi:hypothetical protein
MGLQDYGTTDDESTLEKLKYNRNNLKESPVDLQPLRKIQQNNLTPQPPHSRGPITLTVCVTMHPSTTSRQHHLHQNAPLYMERRIFIARRQAGYLQTHAQIFGWAVTGRQASGKPEGGTSGHKGDNGNEDETTDH